MVLDREYERQRQVTKTIKSSYGGEVMVKKTRKKWRGEFGYDLKKRKKIVENLEKSV